MDKVAGEEKVLTRSIYEVEVTSARPHYRDGQVQRGMFLDLTVLKGMDKDNTASVYVAVPESTDRKSGYWFAKKMNGFGDLSAVFDSMPDDLGDALDVLCAALTGRRVLADLGPGTGEYSNRNSLGETKPVDDVPTTTTEKSETKEDTPAEGTDEEAPF